jgi:hypothetical protein
MLGKLLNRILVPEQRQPEIVCWLPETPHNSTYERYGTTYRGLLHAGIVLSASIPEFGEETTWVYLDIRNESRKALGLGIMGFGLVLSTAGQTNTLACRTLTDYGKECKDILIEKGASHCSIAAGFDPTQRPERAEIVIQANRILAPSYMFRIPFDVDTETIGQPAGSFEELLQLDPKKVRSIRVLPKDAHSQ